MEKTIKAIAYIYNDFTAKFGIPRQSGLVEDVISRIVFEPEYRNPHAVRGLEDFSHIWLLWDFTESIQQQWSPTVHPPRLGGNKRMGVFATRSPFRPNNIGLSCVRLIKIENEAQLGCVLYVAGADLLNNTPIYDIKPYLPYTDSHFDAAGGFADTVKDYSLTVVFPQELRSCLPERYHDTVIKLLEQDPRPSYQNDEARRYGMEYAGYDVRFYVKGNVLTVCEVERLMRE